MPFKSQSFRDAAFIETSAASKQNQWLRSIAALLARVEASIGGGLAAFGAFICPIFFESPANGAARPDIARFQSRGPDEVRRRELTKGFSRSAAAWNRAKARRRRAR